jgi:hypothetical protein
VTQYSTVLLEQGKLTHTTKYMYMYLLSPSSLKNILEEKRYTKGGKEEEKEKQLKRSKNNVEEE